MMTFGTVRDLIDGGITDGCQFLSTSLISDRGACIYICIVKREGIAGCVGIYIDGCAVDYLIMKLISMMRMI